MRFALPWGSEGFLGNRIETDDCLLKPSLSHLTFFLGLASLSLGAAGVGSEKLDDL